MIRRWGTLGIIVMLIVVAGAGLYMIRRARGATPLSITGANILQNNDFSINADADPSMPDGWTRGQDGVRLSDSVKFAPDAGPSLQVQGIDNYLKSPYVSVRPGAEYRVAFRALADMYQGRGSATQVRVSFAWRDAEGTDIQVTKGEWQDVPLQNWHTLSASAQAPDEATQVAIVIQPASDDVVFISGLSMGQLGVRVNPWPQGKQAALAFSFDYETAMGGLIHSKSVVDDPNADTDWRVRAQRMRDGAEQALQLFAPHGIRATFYTNGYNFLTGNPERRTFMGDPTYAWANTQAGHDWQADWSASPWFANDPYTTEAEAPEWYFGSQLKTLQQAQQDIQSHTFAHFSGNFVTADDWRKDFAAWKQVAAEQDVPSATSLAFPWGSSADMSHASWRVLEQNGITSVTRTANSPAQRRSWLADRERWSLQKLPGYDITVIADTYLTPKTRAAVRQDMQAALLNEGAIDVWAHTEEVTSSDQIEAWQVTIDAAMRDFWVAPVPEIVQYAQDVRQVTIDVQAEQPEYRFTVRNNSQRDLGGVTLTLPFEAARILVDGVETQADRATLVLDLKRGQAIDVMLTPAATSGAADDRSTLWPA